MKSSRSPDGAERNPGWRCEWHGRTRVALLHAGYEAPVRMAA